MNFNSLQFLIFLPIVILGYWLIPKKIRWIWLLIASYYFYMSWNPRLVFLILGTTLVSYGAGLLMEKTDKQGLKKFYMIVTIVVCIGTLVFFKYFNFLAKSTVSFINLFSANLDFVELNIILPIGISFYTFQTLSYVIDVYKGKFAAERHLGYYMLFVSFFPQLVAGPIERPGDLIPQLKAPHRFNLEDFFCGLRIMAVGFFYKCVCADFLGIYVNNVFNNVENANALAVFIAGYLFTTQMLCDFAGYSEIATGAARMMGIRLSPNFYRPYLSRSPSDFFRRWHITLTRWFTDYIYIPLGGNRKGVARKILNTFIVFMLCGLWHGANWTYVLWGFYAAAALTIETVFKKPIGRLLAKMKVDPESKTLYFIQVTLTFLLMLVPAGIIFRANDLSHVGQLYTKLFTDWGFGVEYFNAAMSALGVNALSIVIMVLFCAVEIMIWNYGEIGRYKPEPLPLDKRGNSMAAQRTVVFIYAVAAIMLCWIALLASGDISAFQYFQF